MTFGRCIICGTLISFKSLKCPHCGMAIDEAFIAEAQRRRDTEKAIRAAEGEIQEEGGE